MQSGEGRRQKDYMITGEGALYKINQIGLFLHRFCATVSYRIYFNINTHNNRGKNMRNYSVICQDIFDYTAFTIITDVY